MSRLNVLSSLSSFSSRSRLFEELISDALHHYKYRIDRILDAGKNQISIDVQGQFMPTGVPLYAECRCDDHPIADAELQAFYGRYMTRWHKNKACHGIFIALPALAPSAKEFFAEHIENNPDVTAFVYESDGLIEIISDMHGIVSPEMFKRPIAQNIGRLGDHVLLYTEKGIFWAQYIISRGQQAPDRVALFTGNGMPVNDPAIREYLETLYPELGRLENISVIGAARPQPGLFHGKDEVVETLAGSGLFDYHLPASPQFFVGGTSALDRFDSFIHSVRHKKTILRGLVFEAPSGWGKSSTALACAERLHATGQTAVTVDSRTASSPKFAARVLDYAIKKMHVGRKARVPADDAKPLPAFDGSVESIRRIGTQLERHGRMLVVFFDQFENIFFAPNLLQSIEDLFLNVSSAQTNVVLCFLWKTDLPGLDNEPSRSVGRLLWEKSEHIFLDPFSADDITQMFDMLADEIDATISKTLRSSISIRSQGLPWLLKRWFAYVESNVRKGNPPLDILKTIPHIEALFQADIRRLAPPEKNALLYIAKAAPISIFEADKSFDQQIVQSLLARRLVIKIGSVCDVYNDILRNYLISGDLPLFENHVFRAPVTDVQKAVKMLAEKNGSLNMVDFVSGMGLPENALTRLIHEMNLLDLLTIAHGNIALQLNDIRPARQVTVAFRHHLRNKLQRHRPAQFLLRQIKSKSPLTLDEISAVLQRISPHMPTTKTGWRKHAHTLAEYMDAADMAFWNQKNKRLMCLNPATDIRERDLLLPKRRGSKIPWIQYAYVQNILTRLMRALRKREGVDWNGVGKHSIFRALAALEDLEFIKRSAAGLRVLPKGLEFAQNPSKQPALLAASAMKIPSFSIFIDILKTHRDRGNTLLKLGLELRSKLGTHWTENTAELVAKILLDWARHAKLAPGVFAETRKGPIKGWKKKDDRQLPLF